MTKTSLTFIPYHALIHLEGVAFLSPHTKAPPMVSLYSRRDQDLSEARLKEEARKWKIEPQIDHDLLMEVHDFALKQIDFPPMNFHALLNLFNLQTARPLNENGFKSLLQEALRYGYFQIEVGRKGVSFHV